MSADKITPEGLLGGKVMNAIVVGGKVYVEETDVRHVVKAALATNEARNTRIAELERAHAAALEENAALREQLDRLKAELESANRAYADVMRAVDECGSYKP